MINTKALKKIASIVTLCSILSMGAVTFAPQTVDAAPHHGPRIERRMPPPRHMPPPPRRIEHRPPRHVRGHYPPPPPRQHHHHDRAIVAGIIIGAILGATANNG